MGTKGQILGKDGGWYDITEYHAANTRYEQQEKQTDLTIQLK